MIVTGKKKAFGKGRIHSHGGVKYLVDVDKSDASASLTLRIIEVDGHEIKPHDVVVRMYKNLYGEWHSN